MSVVLWTEFRWDINPHTVLKTKSPTKYKVTAFTEEGVVDENNLPPSSVRLFFLYTKIRGHPVCFGPPTCGVHQEPPLTSVAGRDGGRPGPTPITTPDQNGGKVLLSPSLPQVPRGAPPLTLRTLVTVVPSGFGLRRRVRTKVGVERLPGQGPVAQGW